MKNIIAKKLNIKVSSKKRNLLNKCDKEVREWQADINLLNPTGYYQV